MTIRCISVVVMVIWVLQAKATETNQAYAIKDDLIGKSIAWQLHWDKQAGIATPNRIKQVAIKNNQDLEVWVARLDWIINYGENRSQVFPNYFQRLNDEHPDVRKHALDPFERIQERSIPVPEYTNTFQPLSGLNTIVKTKVLDAFKTEACSADMLAFYADESGQRITSPRFWIAPVDTNFPVMLYLVEGAPHIGKVYFDTKSLKAVYSEFNYIGDKEAPWRKERLRQMRAIRLEGDRYELKNGELVPSPNEKRKPVASGS
jgi:hypothetical protein